MVPPTVHVLHVLLVLAVGCYVAPVAAIPTLWPLPRAGSAATMAAHAAVPTPQASQLPVWPLPREVSTGSATASLDPAAFALFAPPPAFSGALAAAFQRFKQKAFPHPATPKQPSSSVADNILAGLTVTIADGAAELALGANESYVLSVPTNGTATLAAVTLFGAYHGLETLSQLVGFDFTTERYSVGAHLPLHIKDEPSYSHRGLLLDTARHFQPVPTLLRVIDSIAMAKLNVFHWHLSDDQSFPAASRTFPELAAKGAWSQTERYTWAGAIIYGFCVCFATVLPLFDD